MGVYIHGMKLPKYIDPELVIEFAEGIEGRKRYARLYHSQYGGLTEWCRAVEVPPHGRLVDGEELAQDAYRRMLECEKYKRPDQKPYEVLRAIELAPTVIPAEEDTNG